MANLTFTPIADIEALGCPERSSRGGESDTREFPAPAASRGGAFQHRLQPPPGDVQPPLDRAHRNFQLPGDPLQRSAAEVERFQRCRSSGFNAATRLARHSAARARTRSSSGAHRHGGTASSKPLLSAADRAAPSQPVDRHAGRDPRRSQPAKQRGLRSCGSLPHGVDEDLLGEFLGLAGVPQLRQRSSNHRPLESGDQVAERDPISRLGQPHQPSTSVQSMASSFYPSWRCRGAIDPLRGYPDGFAWACVVTCPRKAVGMAPFHPAGGRSGASPRSPRPRAGSRRQTTRTAKDPQCGYPPGRG